MTISDIITLVSLVIAIVAILNDRNRQHLLLKFHVVDYILFAVAFSFINYFVFYKSFYSRGFFIPQLYFEDFGLRNPNNFAYIISLTSLAYFFSKIWYAFYPFSKIQNVIKFYKQLVENNETSFLLDLIDKYHKADIIKSIERTKDYDPRDNRLMGHRFKRKTFGKKLNNELTNFVRFLLPYSWFNRRTYGIAVLHRVINDPAFIVLASQQRPYLFAEIFAHFKKDKRDAFPKDLINSFLVELVEHKNFWLKKELVQSQSHDYGQPEWFHDENRILSALFRDLTVADVNEVWRPFGNCAVNEIEEERAKGYESRLFQEFRDEQFLWEYKTYFAIQFQKILIIEAIVEKYDQSHFWLFYYRSITDAILKTLEKYPPTNFEEVVSVYHKLINIMVRNLFLWLDFSNEKEDKSFHANILDCIGSLIHSICNSSYYGEKRKIEIIDSLLTTYCGVEENSESEKIRIEIEAILLKPCMLTRPGDSYYLYIDSAWTEFDKIPHREMSGLGEDYDYLKQLKEKVIIPLGLDPGKD